ncbi:hypothetical protein LPB140_02305 [Sphingorhabdus lutea]|uniref:Uncharacterized protein n=1 Tax=Sphingorhabdus lutea TaxID=1913578 RepID=A0A1L3J9Q9_9SPHN|nr:hypothetical protein [Sphingorhabdus lutea]APG61851.1 hypothetical protein LPB140_02305 [Sphingorhabdus lutea]
MRAILSILGGGLLILSSLAYGGGSLSAGVDQNNQNQQTSGNSAKDNKPKGNDALFNKISAALDTVFVPLENGFKNSKTCPIEKSDWVKAFNHNSLSLVFQKSKTVGHSLNSAMILTWYYSGPEAIIEADDFNNYAFADCFRANDICGLPKDNGMAKALSRPWGPNKGDIKKIRKYFAQKPPASAIAYASTGLGQCFGDDPAQPSMEQLGFVEAKLDSKDCTDLTNLTTNYSPWYRYFKPEKGCLSGKYVPSIGLSRLKEKKEADYRFANRSIEERTAGLNGCQIAYSLVFNGINGQSVGRIPDEAISWALDYEKAVFAKQFCPIMPKALSDWVLKQPLDKFEPAQDPFVAFVKNKPRNGNWVHYVTTVMQYYENSNDPQIKLPDSQCYDFYLWLNGYWTANPFEQNEQRRFLMNMAVEISMIHSKATEYVAVCQRVPRSFGMQHLAARKYEQAKRIEQERLYKEAEDRRRQAEIEYNSARNRQPSVLWNNKPSEQRCYNTGTTQSGLTVMRCFGG